jgi:hypothetical protein
VKIGKANKEGRPYQVLVKLGNWAQSIKHRTKGNMGIGESCERSLAAVSSGLTSDRYLADSFASYDQIKSAICTSNAIKEVKLST